MNRLRQSFRHSRVVLPVTHVTSVEQALRNSQTAYDAGSDGIFLIDHGMNNKALLRIYARVVEAFPGWWVGVNCLGLAPEEVFALGSGQLQGIWCDDASIREDQEHQPEAERILAARRACGWSGLYFGGVAFKYRRPVADPGAAAGIAARYVDVVTTSGPGTGQPASPDKIRVMRRALGDAPLAIASGITPGNVADYLPWADCFLVATGISHSFEELDPVRVHDLIARVRAFEFESSQQRLLR